VSNITYIFRKYFQIVVYSTIFLFAYVLIKKLTSIEFPTPNVNQNSLVFKAFNLLIYAPVIEEIIYRLWLSNLKLDGLISIIFLFLDFIIRIYLGLTIDYFSISLILLIIVSYKFRLISLFPNTLIVINAFIFGYSHIVNFDLDYTNVLIYFVLTPQVIAGYFLSKIRVERGVVFSIFIHLLLNLTSFLSALFLRNA
jgi:hypothetical protein